MQENFVEFSTAYLVSGDEPTDEHRKSTAPAPEVTWLSLFAIHTAVGGTEMGKKRSLY